MRKDICQEFGSWNSIREIPPYFLLKIKKTTPPKNPTKTPPENTLHVCIIYMSRTEYPVAVHPYPFKRWSQDIPGTTLDMQALDSACKSSGKYFLLKYKYPLLTPSRNIKACLEEWKCSTTFSYKLKISKPCWLKASVSETCLLCRQFLYLCYASTFQTSTANVLLRTIQRCCLGHLDDLIGLFFFLAICIKSMIHINYVKGS